MTRSGSASSRHRHRLVLRDRFRAVLAKAMENRDERPDVVDTMDGPELEWMLFERRVMLDEVNRLRVERGFPKVDSHLVLRAERLAVGHVDYHLKFALYCAEIVLGEFLGQP
jgi:hypothetical protein